jgi:hypothetical protein
MRRLALRFYTYNFSHNHSKHLYNLYFKLTTITCSIYFAW